MSDKGDKKRKRRRGGLRVPSDKVPRAKTSPDVTAPAPEDPHLAMSVAYAFGGSAGSPAALDSEPELEGLDTIRNRSLPIPSAEMNDEDDFGDDRTIELDSVAELDEVEPLDGDLTEGATEHPQTHTNGADDEAEIPDDIRTTTPMRPIKASMLAGGDKPGESVDIAFEDEDDGADEVEETDPSADEVEASADDAPIGRPKFHRARTVALSDQDLEELMESELLPTLSFEDSQTVVRKNGDRSGIVEPRDAGDSGEIIADDMIEEIEENAIAKPVSVDSDLPEAEESNEASTSGAPGVPRTTSEERRRPENSDPPPPPPPPPEKAAKAASVKPPPAPAKKPPPAAALAEPRRRKGKPWFEEIFDENYLRTLPFLTPQATEAEADFVLGSLGLEPGSQILDVGCGYGRHSMELAARGYHMVGLDSSLPLLLRGADEAQRRGLSINFVHGDMREMQFESQFDGAFCLFETFGYFDDETNKLTAKNIARSLKPGARMVLDVLNRDYLIRDLPTRVWWEGDGCVILEEVDFNYFSSRIVSTRSIAFEDGRQLEQEISIRAFALHELGKLLHAAGFRVVEVSGSMATRGRFFGGQSRDIIIVAEKRGGTARTSTAETKTASEDRS